MSQNPYSASGDTPGASDPAGTDPAAYPSGQGQGSANPTGGSHPVGSADSGQSSYPPGNEPPYPSSTGSADPYGQQGYPPQQYGQPGYPQQPYGAAGQAPVSESDEKTWGIISHISIPFFWFIGPLIGYLMYKDRSPFLKQV